jgi:hypothetical protein
MPLEPMVTGARYMIVSGLCAIVTDREASVLRGGVDPRRAARAMGW